MANGTNKKPFPIQWAREEDKKYTWTRSQIEDRYPDPVTPLFGDIFFVNAGEAVRIMGEQLDILKKGYLPKYIIFNGYVYANFNPKEMHKLKLLKLLFRLYKLADSVEKDFETKMEKPHLKRVAELDKFQVHTAPLSKLHDHLITLEKAFKDWMVAQDITLVLSELVLRIFRLQTKLLFGSAAQELFVKLTLGLENESVRMSRDIAQLAKLVRSREELSSVFRKHSGRELLSIIEAEPRFGAFKKEFAQFMARNGCRTTHWDFVHPMWWEAPEIPLAFVRDFVVKPIDVKQKIASQMRTRDEAVREVKAKLKSFWRRPFQRCYLRWLDLAQRYTVLKERRQLNMYKVWRPLKMAVKELGKRFQQAGALDNFADIYFLKRQEVTDIVAALAIPEVKAPPQVKPEWKTDFKKIVEERKKAWKQQFKLTPPSTVKWKMEQPKQRPHKEAGLSGIGGSPGKVTAKACLLLSPEEFGKFRAGDILVTKYTNPSWTPLFGLASGVVTESGGMLCHASIVAREYGIPAVVGVHNATALIRDGETLVVDGDKGVVCQKRVVGQGAQ